MNVSAEYFRSKIRSVSGHRNLQAWPHVRIDPSCVVIIHQIADLFAVRRALRMTCKSLCGYPGRVTAETVASALAPVGQMRHCRTHL